MSHRTFKICILGILDDLSIEDNPKKAIGRALFQAHKLILQHWKATDPSKLLLDSPDGSHLKIREVYIPTQGPTRKIRPVVGSLVKYPRIIPTRISNGQIALLNHMVMG